uniref:ADH_zinc_N domain-containing protein n=1 Tax=Ascaris lumbricoides TaxID=6252 RepID=A0A0M3HIZ2_ASCLU
MEMLRNLGADVVLTENQFEKKQKDVVKSLHGPVKLALNAAGGHSALLVSSALDRGGTMVTYGLIYSSYWFCFYSISGHISRIPPKKKAFGKRRIGKEDKRNQKRTIRKRKVFHQ